MLFKWSTTSLGCNPGSHSASRSFPIMYADPRLLHGHRSLEAVSQMAIWIYSPLRYRLFVNMFSPSTGLTMKKIAYVPVVAPGLRIRFHEDVWYSCSKNKGLKC